MKEAILALEPKLVWKNFYDIGQIPRCSKHEGKIRQFLINFAKDHDLEWKTDEVGNVLIRKPATPGMENHPIAVIQGHMDMVCEKNKDTRHDFSKDPIKMKIEGEWVTADGTTLGADNGIALAISLAIMEDNTVEHPPLEFLFTVDEETGLTGATALKSDMLNGRYLLNIDSEEESTLFIGCAGGQNTSFKKAIEWEDAQANTDAFLLKVSGLHGGHSGLNINGGFGNAIKLLARVLYNLTQETDYRLAYISGGSAHNAIPREAEALITIPKGKTDTLKEFAQKYQNIFRDELKFVDKDVVVKVEDHFPPKKVFASEFRRILVNTLYAMPHGVLAMSHAVEGMVETSTNLATISTDDEKIEILTSQRSSIASSIIDSSDKVKALGELGKFDVVQNDGYPAWQPNPDSKLLHICKDIYQKSFNKEPKVMAIHAGLECGIIGEKYDGMDMISFGPDIFGAHSPDEKIRIESVQHIWNYLLEILRRLK